MPAGVLLVLRMASFVLLCATSYGITLTPVLPVGGELGAGSSSGLGVWVEGTSQTSLEVRFHARPLVSGPDFTIVALGDTQNYSGGDFGGAPAMFVAQVDWIVANRISRNIAFVAHLGDIVQRGDYVAAEWQAATDAMYRLENPLTTRLEHGIPYGIAVGNHDGQGWGPYGYNAFYWYNRCFGVPHFQDRPYYGGHFGTNNNNHFVLFSAGGLDFIVLDLEFAAGANAAVMNWANGVLRSHANRRAIVVSHSLLYNGTDPNNLPFSPEGAPIYEGIKTNTNVFLMLCGHDPQAGLRRMTFANNTITILRSNYENETNGGNGWLRTLEFSPSNNLIRVRTYSPLLNEHKTNRIHQFTLTYDMQDFRPVATISNAGLGLVTSGSLSNLPPGQAYEWFAEANVGREVSRSTVAQFRLATTTVQDPTSLRVLPMGRTQQGHFLLWWRSVGGQRYRVEYCDGDRDGGFTGKFKEIVRSEVQELDPACDGAVGVSFFTDDFTLTGGPPPHGARFFRIKKLH